MARSPRSLYASPLRSPWVPRDRERVGVLLTNLGTPDAPTAPALRRYLAQFLWDPRVVELPRWLWWLILHGIVLRTRPAKSAHAYATVWTDAGSPLLIGTRKVATALQTALGKRTGEELPVVVGMRYGNPSIANALEELAGKGVTRVLLLPLYPQYSAATTGSTVDAVAQAITGWRWPPELRTVNSYATDPGYVSALAATVREAREQHGKPDLLMMSYHGVPQRYVDCGDPYRCECSLTSLRMAEAAGLAPADWRITFQSRFGREEWLQPYTDDTFETLGSDKLDHLHVICPGFSIDCLETLEEIGITGREQFTTPGGGTFHYIPCLNDRPDHIAALADIAMRHMGGWLGNAQPPVSPVPGPTGRGFVASG